MRRKECGTRLPTVGETRQSRLENSSSRTQMRWTGDIEICSVSVY